MSDAAHLNGFSWLSADAETERRFSATGAERFGLTFSEFSEIISDILAQACDARASQRERKRLLDTLRLEELVLARACARGHESAWAHFISAYRAKLYAAAIVITGEELRGRELADSLYADLYGTRLGPDGSRVSKLNSYSGRGSLEGWLRTLLAQEFVNRYRKARRLVSFDESLEHNFENAPDLPASPSHQIKLGEATGRALEALSSEEQFVLSSYYLDGRTLAEIGRTLGVHESTIARRIERVTANLRGRIVRELRQSGLSRQTTEELLATDVCDLQIDLRSSLEQKTHHESFSRQKV